MSDERRQDRYTRQRFATRSERLRGCEKASSVSEEWCQTRSVLPEIEFGVFTQAKWQ